jgi:predicted dehydrogenase
MTDTKNTGAKRSVTRRDFARDSLRITAASALAGMAIPHVHAGEDNTIRLALIGCGGRGSGAVANAMAAGGLVMDNRFRAEDEENAASSGPVKLVAMADLLQSRLDSSHKALSKLLGDKVDVPEERRFRGFDAYKKAIDCLRPGDVAMLTTHAAFRVPHLEYAVEKGVNVFMEKDFAADPGGIQKIIRAGEAAKKKNLKIATGLMCRHSSARQALIQKIRDGAMGDTQLIRAYRMGGSYRMGPFKGGENELLWQLRPGHPFQFLWSSGGVFIELMIHQIDECFWIKDSWPVAAHGVGGRVAGSTDCSQNLDSYSIEYTFDDGTKAMVVGRYIPNCKSEFGTYVHGTKCAAKFSGNIHAPKVRLYKSQQIDSTNIAWRPEREKVNPWQAEWNVLLGAIRNDRPHNEARRAALSNLGAIMGRAAVHTGQVVTWEEALASKFQFCPNVAELTEDSPAPVQADKDGCYPAPIPGAWSEI